MIVIIRSFIGANDFPFKTLKKYWKTGSISEHIIDVLLPILLSIFMVIYAASSVNNFHALIEKFQQISGQVIAAISILAGFNVASITILASTNTSSIEMLRTNIDSRTNLSYYEMLISFFTWAVIIQLFVVLTSIIMFYMGSFIPEYIKGWGIPLWAWIIAAAWLSITMHSIFLSIRNMKTLYLYVTYVPPQPPAQP